MALEEFWRNVTAAAAYFDPQVYTDSPDLHPDLRERGLRRAALWLTPSTVEGFDDGDFAFMAQPERDELTACVEDFRRVAETVPDNGHATREQIREAVPMFQRILEALQPGVNPDVEAFRSSKALARLRIPNVASLLHEFDTDSTGDPVIRVWAILKDEVADRPTFFQETEEIRERIDIALRRQGIRRWPHIRFRTVSEQADLNGGGRR